MCPGDRGADQPPVLPGKLHREDISGYAMPFSTASGVIARGGAANSDAVRRSVVIVAFFGLHRSNQMLSLLAPSLYKGQKGEMSFLELAGDLSTFCIAPSRQVFVFLSGEAIRRKPMKDLSLNGI